MKDINKIYFPGKEPDEKIMIILRRHKVVILKKLLMIFLSGIIPVLAYFGMNSYTAWLDDPSSLIFMIIVLLASLFYLYWLLMIYESWVNYFLDVWIITNERIISMEQVSLFHREVAELRLNAVQDVSSDARGILPTLFRYGNILVQTAAETQQFNFTEVARPDEVARQILELHEQYVGRDQPTAEQPQIVDRVR